mmetsp:Transcript_17431/g.53369  ORF Transcript_17431/g.53369 Transcript_17431/m.53369 type:complete len:252 (+) Transcript_17431:352-1107(+)
MVPQVHVRRRAVKAPVDGSEPLVDVRDSGRGGQRFVQGVTALLRHEVIRQLAHESLALLLPLLLLLLLLARLLLAPAPRAAHEAPALVDGPRLEHDLPLDHAPRQRAVGPRVQAPVAVVPQQPHVVVRYPDELRAEARLGVHDVAALAADALADHLAGHRGRLGDDDVPDLDLPAVLRPAGHEDDGALGAEGGLHGLAHGAGHEADVVLDEERRAGHLPQDERRLPELPRRAAPRAAPHARARRRRHGELR